MTPLPPNCLVCLYYEADLPLVQPLPNKPPVGRCQAFPQGIPADIYWENQPHTASRQGDHGLVFTPKKR